MSLTSYIFGIASAALVVVVVVELLRRRLLRERHAVWWFVAGVLALVAGIFPATLTWAAAIVGIEVPINLVFFVSVAILFFVCLQHSSELTKLESKTRMLAERVALMELKMRGDEGVDGHQTGRIDQPEKKDPVLIRADPPRSTPNRGT